MEFTPFRASVSPATGAFPPFPEEKGNFSGEIPPEETGVARALLLPPGLDFPSSALLRSQSLELVKRSGSEDVLDTRAGWEQTAFPWVG